jgi:2-octaprenyl-6-methoxyphenol hydroxylase
MQTDITIVGGGMVGATLACALHHTDPELQITLIDAYLPKKTPDARLIALNYGSIELLKKLTLFEPLKPFSAAIQAVHISHKGHFGAARIHADELNLPQLGCVIPASYINQVLEEKLQQSSVNIIRPATLIELNQTADKVNLTLKSPEQTNSMTSQWVIAADGTHSTVREKLAIPTEKHDYQQSALVAVVGLKRSHHHVAYERFLAQGAIAMLPLTENRCAVIWSGVTSQIDELMQTSDDMFLQSLQKQFGYRLGRLATIGYRAVYPLHLVQAKNRLHNRVLLIGNAAHTVHPLAAQGLNLAFREIALLTQLISKKSLAQLDLAVMNDYPFSQKITMQLSHYLNTLFSVDFPPVNFLRQLGLLGLDSCSLIKQQFAMYPAGCA